ncbi:MAG: hypothetical protein Q4F69_11850, partial [Bacteroidia bacterium]|nr:hypothetical protein [Bacteroidia bacterium]
AGVFYTKKNAAGESVELDKYPEGSIHGAFTVSENKKVFFSKGNLWCNAAETPVTWNFEANQYDNRCYNGIENDAAVINGELTTTPTNTVGALLFYNASGNPYMYPYVNGSISESEILFTNGQTAETADKPNPTFTVEGEIGVYRVLSENEWGYLMGRESYSKFGFANIKISDVDVVNGLVILPDLYAVPEGCSFTSGKESDWNTNQYTTEQWDKMEDAGAVFLPAAGYSTCHKDNPYLLSQYSERGDYMSCNGAIDDGYKYMHFCTQTHEPEAGTQIAAGLLSTTIHGYCGMSIRLVSDVISE